MNENLIDAFDEAEARSFEDEVTREVSIEHFVSEHRSVVERYRDDPDLPVPKLTPRGSAWAVCPV